MEEKTLQRHASVRKAGPFSTPFQAELSSPHAAGMFLPLCPSVAFVYTSKLADRSAPHSHKSKETKQRDWGCPAQGHTNASLRELNMTGLFTTNTIENKTRSFWPSSAAVLTRPAWAKSSWTAVLQAPLQLEGQTWFRTSVTGESSLCVIPFCPNASLISCSIVCWKENAVDHKHLLVSRCTHHNMTSNHHSNKRALFQNEETESGEAGTYGFQFEVLWGGLVEGHSFEEMWADLHRDGRQLALDGLWGGLHPAGLLSLRFTTATLHRHTNVCTW